MKVDMLLNKETKTWGLKLLTSKKKVVNEREIEVMSWERVMSVQTITVKLGRVLSIESGDLKKFAFTWFQAIIKSSGVNM